jgi:hypothetical protein
LSVTETDADRVPVAVGVKVTEIVQLFFGSSDVPQVFVCAKSDPVVMVRLVMLIEVPPLALDMVMVCAALVVPTVCAANVRLVGEKDAAVLVPDKVTVCVPALSVIVKVAERWLMLMGLKTTLMVQVLLPASDVPQLLVCEKSVAFAPEKAMLVIVRVVAPAFVRVTFCAVLEVPSTCVGKASEVGFTNTVAVPVPVRGTV